MLRGWPTLTPELPALGAWADYVGWLRDMTQCLESFVVIGDSFGATVALAAAAARVRGLDGVVASGGFASNPLRLRAMQRMVRSGPHVGGRAYRYGVLPLHARLLASRYDLAGDRPWKIRHTVGLFRRHTPAAAYWARAGAAVTGDLRPDLHRIAVPTLLISPDDDHLIAPDSVEPLRAIVGVVETRLPQTGHMFRFSHPFVYGDTVRNFFVGRFANA